MSTAEILRITHAPGGGRLGGFCLDMPTDGACQESFALRLAGWAIGSRERIAAVSISFEGTELRRAPVELERPDVAEVHGSSGATSGFDASIGLASLPRAGRVRLEACFEDGQEPLCEIDYRRAAVESGFAPMLQPLAVTSLFRMGTTRLMRLLAEHPDVVVEQSYPYETCVASYWLHAFRILSEPANLNESSHPDDFAEGQRWIGHNPFHRSPVADDPSLARWMGRDSVEQTLAFCQRSAEGFYRTVATAQGKREPRYFAEKLLPDTLLPDAFQELYPGSREVFLVRDFRDVICSMIAFNAKRGYPSFGRQKVDSDAQMIERFAGRCRGMADAWRRRSDSAILVHYENLVRHPNATMTALLGDAGLDDSAVTVDRLIERADQATAEMSFHRTARSPLDSIERWRRELPDETAQWAAELLRAPLETFGYASTASAVPG